MSLETAPGTVSFCGHCGTPVAGSSAFCGHCGQPLVAPPPLATMPVDPVAAAHAVPAARPRLSHRRLLMLAGGICAVVVVVLTTVVVVVRPGSSPCHFTCGAPSLGRLFSTSEYTSSQFGFRVEYARTGDLAMPVAGQGAAELDLGDPSSGTSETITGTAGSDVNAAVQAAVDGVNTNVIRGMQEIGPVSGAQIGFVPGTGVAYSATFVPANGGQATSECVVVIAASRGNMTISAIAEDPADTSVTDAPAGCVDGFALDLPLENTIWPGS